jgi:hypothetical protein
MLRASGASSSRRSAISTTLVSEQSQSNATWRTSRRNVGGKLTDSFFTPPEDLLALSRSIAVLTVTRAGILRPALARAARFLRHFAFRLCEMQIYAFFFVGFAIAMICSAAFSYSRVTGLLGA